MKKILALLMIPVMLFAFASCTEAARPDYAMFSRRLAEINEHYAFEYFDMFLYDGAYHVYFSLCSEDDILLSMHMDDDGNIDDLTVTASAEKMKTDGQRNAFLSFSTAAVESFAKLSDREKAELNSKLSYKSPKIYFSDLYETYSALRYNFTFSSNSEFINFYCEYYEIIEEIT